MVKLIPVQYGVRSYPEGIRPKIQEIAGHFDKTAIHPLLPRFSLHTEYSCYARELCSPLLSSFPTLCSSHRQGIPQLWYSEAWAAEFAEFIRVLCAGQTPSVIEIHPPFSDYTDFAAFLSHYAVFEERILSVYPQVRILIENRFGTAYRGAPFLFSSARDFLELAERLDASGLHLQIAWDIPQFFTALGSSPRTMETDLHSVAPVIHAAAGIHLWGKKDSGRRKRVAHCGSLDDYFRGKSTLKRAFLACLHDLLGDGLPRLFVPEVNSGQSDLDAIVRDLLEAGFRFEPDGDWDPS